MKITLFMLSIIIFVSGCSMFVSGPETMVKGDKTICILFNESRFKNEIVDNIKNEFERDGYRVITDHLKRRKYYKSSDYGAVVYMAEYWAWHTPIHAKRFFEENKQSQNTLFLVTSGDPNVEIHKPFDAVTSASSPDKFESVSNEIIEKLNRILK